MKIQQPALSDGGRTEKQADAKVNEVDEETAASLIASVHGASSSSPSPSSTEDEAAEKPADQAVDSPAAQAAVALGTKLGIMMDLTPSGLVKHAIESGEGAGGDWKGFESRHKQANADSVAFGLALEQVSYGRLMELPPPPFPSSALIT